MRIFFIIAVIVIMGWAFSSCKSSSTPPTFCDTSCLKDSLKFTREDNPLQPYLYISAKNCTADTVVWSYSGMGINRKMAFGEMLSPSIKLNKDFVRCNIYDTSYVWLLLNDCSSGRGYFLNIPFSKDKKIRAKGSAINDLDPKFSVADGLVAYSDRGNIFVEEMATGKTAMMTFGQDTDVDYDAIHETIDSVNVSSSRIWVKVKLKDEWKELEKNISLK